jgi:thioesterase domain-containing protein
VGLVALIDTPPLVTDKLAQLRMSLEFLFTTALPFIWPYVYDYVDLQLKELKRAATGAGLWRWFEMVSLRLKPAPANGQPDLLSLLRVFLANVQATNAYTPQPYGGSLTLVRTGQTFGHHGQSPDLGWRALAAGGVTIYRTPGHHLNLLKQPNVQVLAKRLRALLDQVKG